MNSRTKQLLTYSKAQSFGGCRCKYNYRYNLGIVPVDTPTPLTFGSAVHAALEAWFKYNNLDLALDCARGFELDMENLLKAEELVTAYAEHYGVDFWEIVALETEFRTPLRNPATGRPSPLWTAAGKLDGLVRIDGELYILEHKTTASITPEYLWKIKIDSQIAIYAAYYPTYGEPIVGAIYDILEKPSIRMKKGETEEEYEERKAALIAKSKTGKTTAQRQMPETEDEFRERLEEKITKDSFHREVVKFTDEDLYDAKLMLWNVARDIRVAEKENTLYRNTSQCNIYGGCEYLPLCTAGGDTCIVDSMYTTRRPHCELSINEEDNND